MFQYDEVFYKDIEQMNMDETIIIPMLLQWFSPRSVVDFGCGEGLWLKEVRHEDAGIDILGLDGKYVKKERLKIPSQNFKAVDLRKPFTLNRKFDMAISTEVAEHLEEKYAEIFIDNITNAAENILFSAAVPGQRGTNHINEQWQSYWIKKFEERGFSCDYSIRDYFWEDKRINSWRRQNLLFFSKSPICLAPKKQLMDVIHPEERSRIQRRLRKEFEEREEHYILHPEIYVKLDQLIARLVTQNRKIVIYPYGTNGQLCEKILRIKYKFENYILSDNKVTSEGKQIFKTEELKELADHISVIDTCGNPFIHKEILNNIRKYVDVRNIYSAFEFHE